MHRNWSIFGGVIDVFGVGGIFGWAVAWCGGLPGENKYLLIAVARHKRPPICRIGDYKNMKFNACPRHCANYAPASFVTYAHNAARSGIALSRCHI